jgi:hypothetical protein
MMTISIMNSEPMKAPSRPAEAGAARESTLVNSVQAKPLEMTPSATNWSISVRAAGASCCCASLASREILPLIQLTELAEASRSKSTV